MSSRNELGWRVLREVPKRERYESRLQAYFDTWDSRAVIAAGAPRWLLDAGAPDPRRSFHGIGYRFRPDVMWTTIERRRLVELKYTDTKGEPLALAEVLHHAFMLEQEHDGPPVDPVIISSYQPWLRGAVSWLNTKSQGSVGVSCLEVDVLEDREKDQEFLWFDDPHAPWQLSQCPTALAATHGEGWHWYWIPATSSWCATLRAQDARPLFHVERYLMAAEALDRAGRSRGLLVWQGQPPRAGGGSQANTWRPGRFCVVGD